MINRLNENEINDISAGVGPTIIRKHLLRHNEAISGSNLSKENVYFTTFWYMRNHPAARLKLKFDDTKHRGPNEIIAEGVYKNLLNEAIKRAKKHSEPENFKTVRERASRIEIG